MPVSPTGQIIDEKGSPTSGQVDVATGQLTTPSPINSGTITSESVSPITPNNFKTPASTPPESVEGITFKPAEVPLSPIETQADTATQRLLDINNALAGKTAFTQQKQTEFGVPEKNQAIADLTQQFNDLQKKEAVIKTEYGGALAQNRGVLEPFVTGERDARLRQNAVEALTISSTIDAANGLLASAQRKVDMAVQQKYGPLEEEQRIKKENLAILEKSPALTRAQKDRLNAQEANIKKIDLEIAQKKQETNDIWNTSVIAAQNMANFRPTTEYATSAQAIQAIQNAKTKEIALKIATDTGMTKQPPAQSDFEQAFLRDKGRLPTVAELTAHKKAIAEAGRALPAGENPNKFLTAADVASLNSTNQGANINLEDTRATAQQKIDSLDENKLKTLITSIKTNGHSYDDVVKEIQNDKTIANKNLAGKVAAEVYGVQGKKGFWASLLGR